MALAFDPDYRRLVIDARRILEIDRLVLQIHAASFPADPSDDAGRGTPYSRGAASFLELVRELGFDGLLLGPMGELSPGNPSPYDSTAFSRNPVDLSLEALADAGLVDRRTASEWAARAPSSSRTRADDAFAAAAAHAAVDEAFARHAHRLGTELGSFCRAQAHWLEHDALYSVLTELHGNGDYRTWPLLDAHLLSPRPGEERACSRRTAELKQRFAGRIDRYAFAQWLVHGQHAAFWERCRKMGLALYGDLHIGLSLRDRWSRQDAFLPGYALGAPPSRTNPEGQPWGYPVGDPQKPAARTLVTSRLEKLFSEFDGVRIDHPHGLVCPWVYRVDHPDALEAVQRGARLFESPDLPDHPLLARYAIARPEQLDRSRPRYADDWVRSLEPLQIDRYAALFDEIVSLARGRGRSAADLLCEVLSTLPFPLRKVLERHSLGRFRVTQKIDLDDPGDVYRSENAEPRDWIMVGNHDTPPIWSVAERWCEQAIGERHASYLAERLYPPGQRERFVRTACQSPARLARAKLAELFSSRARNVLVFFTDLLGMRETYNAPGTVGPENWTLRVPFDFRRRYEDRLREGAAFDLAAALAQALDAKGRAPDLARALRERSPAGRPLTRSG